MELWVQVANAVAAQLGVLNTNSRYLHEVGNASGETTSCVHPAI